MIDWQQIDTVMLDMDGTLLDLAYDNLVWNTLLPEHYGAHHGIDAAAAREHLFPHMLSIRGQLDFYCLDYWANYTGLDILHLHHQATHLIGYRPSARAFLEWLKTTQRQTWLVTNAHPDSVTIKHASTGLCHHLDAVVSCHEYGEPKESATFWERLHQARPFNPERTLFVDDNHDVLQAAHNFGVRHLFTITQPDSLRPPRTDLVFPAFNDFCEICPGIAKSVAAAETPAPQAGP